MTSRIAYVGTVIAGLGFGAGAAALIAALFSFPAHAQATCPDGWTCKIVAERFLPGGTPPVDPPPVEPPPASGSRAHWERECAKVGVAGCVAWDSPKEVIASAIFGTAIPNSNTNPITSPRCRWNGGDQDCYPAFDLDIQTEIDETVKATCSKQDQLEADPSVPRQQNTSLLSAMLWGPCYDTEMNAARLRVWNDPGSSKGWLGKNFSEAPVHFADKIAIQMEIAFDATNWRARSEYISDNYKIFRLEQTKDAECPDKRLFDLRTTGVSEDNITILGTTYCSVMYTEGDLSFSMSPTWANKWLRITFELDLVADTVRAWYVDSATGEVLQSGEQTTWDGVPIDLDRNRIIRYAYAIIHMTSGTANRIDGSPPIYYRHVIISQESIDP